MTEVPSSIISDNTFPGKTFCSLACHSSDGCRLHFPCLACGENTICVYMHLTARKNCLTQTR